MHILPDVTIYPPTPSHYINGASDCLRCGRPHLRQSPLAGRLEKPIAVGSSNENTITTRIATSHPFYPGDTLSTHIKEAKNLLHCKTGSGFIWLHCLNKNTCGSSKPSSPNIVHTPLCQVHIHFPEILKGNSGWKCVLKAHVPPYSFVPNSWTMH